MDGLLRYIDAQAEVLLPFGKGQGWRNVYSGSYINLEDYFPSEVERTVKRMERKGLVVKEEVETGIRIKITEKGKKEVLQYKLDEFTIKSGDWDGKWRIVFFDIEEVDRKKRNKLRKILVRLGMKQLQKSLWVSPYEIEKEVRYVRELLEIPHDVKLGYLENFENEIELREMFELK